jgi:hypothetical protein
MYKTEASFRLAALRISVKQQNYVRDSPPMIL